MEKISITCVDDHKLFSEGLSAIINMEVDMEVVNSYPDGLNIMEAIAQDKPDILLLDLQLPVKSGLSIAKEIRSISSSPKIIVLSMKLDLAIADQLKQINVEAYVPKDIQAEKLIQIIRKVYHENEIHYFSPQLNKATVEVLTSDFQLTTREIEIIELLNQGFSTKEIADKLNRSIFTITTHRKNINQKLATKNKTHPFYSFLNRLEEG